MASSEKATCSQETPTGRKSVDEPTDKRKRPLLFSGHQDIQLLREVLSLDPFQDAPLTTPWESISRNLEDELAISPRGCRERTLELIDQYMKGDLESLERFCTEDELTIKKRLLQEVLLQFEIGFVAYKDRIGSGMVMAQNAANGNEDDDDEADYYRRRCRPEDYITSERSEQSSDAEEKDDEQPGSPKRPRLTEDGESKAAAPAASAGDREH